MAGKWVGSRRREQLPADWKTVVRPKVIARDGGRCTWVDGLPDGGRPLDPGMAVHPGRCTEPGTDVDHVGDPADHRPENQRLLCSWHHDRRSSAQGNAARRRLPGQRRPPERHPGILR